MPVIQLPRDTRWGDLGTGLGQAIGGALEGYANKRADEAVAQIVADPLLTEPAKLTKIMKEVPGGLDRYKGLVTAQVLQATVKEKTAEAAKNQAAVDQLSGQTDLIRMLNGLPPKAAAPTTGVLSPVPAVGTPVAPVGAAATAPTPTATSTSVIPDVLAGGSAAASAPAPATAAPTPTTSATAAPSASGAIVGALSGTPTPTLTPLERMIDERAAMGGVIFTPAERQNLVMITNGHLSQKTGLSEAMAPVDAAIAMKKGGLELPSKLASGQAGATTAQAGAVTAEAKARVDLAEAQAKLDELRVKAPYTGPLAAAQTQTAQAGATTAAAGAKAAGAVAANAAAQATAAMPLAEIEAQAKAQKLIAEANHSQQMTAQGMPVDMPTETIGAAYPSTTQEQRQVLSQIAKVQGGAKFNEVLQQFVKENTDAARKQTPQIVQDVAAMLPAVQSYHATLDQIEKYPNMQGGPVSGVLAPLIAKYGLEGTIPFVRANPEVLQQMTTSEQLTLQTVEGHHGMGGAFLVPLVSTTMPSAAKSKLFSVIETNVKAEDYLAKLGSYRAAYQAAGMDTRQLDEATTAAQKLYDRSSTLWWTGPTADNPNAVSRVFYKGREVDPATFLPVKGGVEEYKPQDFFNLGNNRSVTGADLNADARVAGKTPPEILAIYRSQASGMPR